MREAMAKGWKMVWRQARPPRAAGSVIMGPMTLTSWARLAALTRSACRSRQMSSPPTTRASAPV